MTARWQAEKEKLGQARRADEQLDRRAPSWIRRQRRGDFSAPASCAYGEIPELEKHLAEAEADRAGPRC